VDGNAKTGIKPHAKSCSIGQIDQVDASMKLQGTRTRSPYSSRRWCAYTIFAVTTLGISSVIFTGTALAAPKSFTCNPDDVSVYPQSRVHVHCSPGDGSIEFFALGVTDAAEANRVLSVILSALVARRQLTIFYDSADTTGASFGCDPSNCRSIQGVSIF
jgi:hypothetical protein